VGCSSNHSGTLTGSSLAALIVCTAQGRSRAAVFNSIPASRSEINTFFVNLNRTLGPVLDQANEWLFQRGDTMNPEPAFPVTITEYSSQTRETHTNEYPGLSIRQWYAGMALSGYVAAFTKDDPDPDYAAAMAFKFADAMIRHEERG